MPLGHSAVVFFKDFTLPTNREAITDPADSAPPDCEMMKTYLRLLDANQDQADWREAATIILNLDVKKDPESSRAVFERSLIRALWLRDRGYLRLVRQTSI